MSFTDLELDADVVVVGGGLSGLVAVNALAEKGLAVRVLEAKDRVGGRTLNFALDGGGALEAGGQWMYPHHAFLAELADSLGVPAYEHGDDGERLLRFRGEVHRHEHGVSVLTARSRAELVETTAKLDELSHGVPAATPWTAPDAATLDGQSLGALLRR